MRHSDQIVMFLFMAGLAIAALIGNYIMITFQDEHDRERHADIKKRAEEAKKNWKKAHFNRKISAIKAKAQASKQKKV